MGIFDFLSGSGSSRQATNSSTNSNSTTTQSSNPWEGIRPYLTGGDGVRGIFPEAARLYEGTGWTPAMSDAVNNWFNDIANRRNIFNGNGFANAGADMVAGQFDPRIAAVGPIGGPSPIAPLSPTPAGARQSQGELDPTAALKSFLSGDQTNPWIGQQGQAITDTLTRNLLETVAPQIRHEAIAEGQYGGSRDALALGSALQRMDMNIAPALTQLAGDTWEAEQGRKLGVATDLNRQAGDFAQANADRKLRSDSVNAGNLLDTQRFNAGTALANNSQEMQRAAQSVASRGAGLDFATGVAGLQDKTYADMLKALNLPQDFDWDRFARYASIIEPAAGLFPTITSNTNASSNTSGMTTGSRNSSGGSAQIGPMLDLLLGQFLV